MTIDEKLKIRREMNAIQKNISSASSNFNEIQSAYGKIEKIVNSSVSAIHFYKSSYDQVVGKLNQATKQLALQKGSVIYVGDVFETKI